MRFKSKHEKKNFTVPFLISLCGYEGHEPVTLQVRYVALEACLLVFSSLWAPTVCNTYYQSNISTYSHFWIN